MKRGTTVFVRLLAVLCVTLASLTLVHAKTKLVMTWKNPEYTGPKPHRVLVIGVGNDLAIRADFEDAMSEKLSRDGIEAIPGHTLLLRPEPGSKPNLDYLRLQVRDHKIDTVMVTHLVHYQKEVTYFAPSLETRSFYGYYGTVYVIDYTPGYLREDTKVQIETRVFATTPPNGELVWTATTNSFDPKSKKKVVEDVVKLVEKELMKDQLVGNAH
jgi:outer membrane protein assembly factor BamB